MIEIPRRGSIINGLESKFNTSGLNIQRWKMTPGSIFNPVQNTSLHRLATSMKFEVSNCNTLACSVNKAKQMTWSRDGLESLRILGVRFFVELQHSQKKKYAQKSDMDYCKQYHCKQYCIAELPQNVRYWECDKKLYIVTWHKSGGGKYNTA